MNPFSRILFLLACGSSPGLAQEPPAVSLPDLVAQVSASHPELRHYQAEAEAARAELQSSGARNNPELAVELGRRRLSDPAGLGSAEGTAWGVSVTQTFEWPGRLALRKAIANRQLELAELGLARFQSGLSARTSVLAYGLYAAETKAAATAEVAARFKALKETFLARDPAGITPLLETRVIEASELALQRRATEASLEARSALAELNQLRGQPVDAPLRVTSVRLAFRPAPPVATLLASARERNFEYLARRLELEQQGFVVQLARNERHPAISVTPYYSQAKAGEKETNYGVGLSVPLPVTARSRGAVEVARAREEQAKVALLLAERELERELLRAAQAFEAKSGEVARWSADAVARFREAAELADRHYRLGAVPIGTYVELQHSYLDAVAALLDTEREALEAGFALRQLSGAEFAPVEVLP